MKSESNSQSGRSTSYPSSDQLDQLRKRSEENLDRVRNLVAIYERLGTNGRRRNGHDTDLLRAAVVLLHASLEDFIRSLVVWRIPSSDPPAVKPMRVQISLDRLLEHREQAIGDFLEETIDDYLERRTFNNKDDVKKALKSIGITPTDLKISELETAMIRRHKIVHRADRGGENEAGKVSPIQAASVNKWIDRVGHFMYAVMEKLK